MTNALQTLIKLFFIFITISSYACDICSCASSNSGGIGMGGNSNYISLNYSYLNFRFKDGIHDNSPYGTDYIHQININGQYKIVDRWLLQLNIPFQKNIRSTEDDKVNNLGIGDISLYSHLYVLNKDNHKLKVGAGIKFPTGKFDYDIASTTNTSALQLGTGSFDFGFPLEYTFVKDKFSSQLKATYFYKTENENNFKFGDQTQLQWLTAYQVFEGVKSAYNVNVGASYDLYEEAEIRGNKALKTDGYLLNATIGLKCNLEKMALGASYQVPIDQNIIEQEVSFKNSFSLYAIYNF